MRRTTLVLSVIVLFFARVIHAVFPMRTHPPTRIMICPTPVSRIKKRSITSLHLKHLIKIVCSCLSYKIICKRCFVFV